MLLLLLLEQLVSTAIMGAWIGACLLSLLTSDSSSFCDTFVVSTPVDCRGDDCGRRCLPFSSVEAWEDLSIGCPRPSAQFKVFDDDSPFLFE
jgi:hypothetical protein